MEPTPPTPFFERLKQRKVVQWTLAYLSGAWLILQVVDVVGEQFAWPDALERAITVTLAVGLLPAVVLAWYHGEKGHQRITRTETLLLAALGLFGAGAVVGTLRGDASADVAAALPDPPGGATVTLDSGAVAVLPFAPTVPDSSLDRLGRDLAVTVSAALDGIDEIRTVDGLTILAQLPPDRAVLTLSEARRLAVRLGAGRVVRGSLSRESDGIRADGTLRGADGRVVARATVRVPGDTDLEGLTDSLTLGLVRQLWERPTGELPSPAALDTRSAEALRAYVQGEEALARGQMTGAVAAFERAFAHDSTYWFAYWRSLYPRVYEGSRADPEILADIYEHRDELPVVDRLLVEAHRTATLRERLPLLEEATELAPTHWSAWYTLANLLIHHAPYVGTTYRDSRAALDRVTALNPSYASAWIHLFWIVVHQRDTAAVRDVMGHLRQFVEPGDFQFDPDREFYYGTTARAVTAGDRLRPDDLSGVADYATAYTGPLPPSAFGTGLLIMGLPRSTVQLADTVLARRPGAALTTSMWRGKAYAWAGRGAWDSTTVAVDRWVSTGGSWPDRLNGYGLLAAGAALDVLDPGVAGARRPDRVPEDASPEERAELAWLDGIVAYAAGDAPGLSSARGRVQASASRYVALLDRSLEALQLRHAGQADRAADRLAAVEDSAANHYVPAQIRHIHPYVPTVHRVLLGRWLMEAGRPDEAARALTWAGAVHPDGPLLEVVNRTVGILGTYERARAEEAMGRTDDALAHYLRFLDSFDTPSETLQGVASDARRRAEALAPRIPG